MVHVHVHVPLSLVLFFLFSIDYNDIAITLVYRDSKTSDEYLLTNATGVCIKVDQSVEEHTSKSLLSATKFCNGPRSFSVS